MSASEAQAAPAGVPTAASPLGAAPFCVNCANHRIERAVHLCEAGTSLVTGAPLVKRCKSRRLQNIGDCKLQGLLFVRKPVGNMLNGVDQLADQVGQ